MACPVPDDADCLAAIKQTVCDPSFEVLRAKDAILIQKLQGGPLQFLHKLFVSGEDIASIVEGILGFPIPLSYANFFSLSNGATLFDNSLFVFGIDGAESREISIDDIRPLSLKEHVDIQRQIDPGRQWVEVGSVAAATKTYAIQIKPDGVTAVCDPEGPRREYPAFLPLVTTLVQILAQHSGPQGLIDPTAEALQSEIDRFIAAARQ
jgi:hypothetical protein